MFCFSIFLSFSVSSLSLHRRISIRDSSNFKPQLEKMGNVVEVLDVASGWFFLISLFPSFAQFSGAGRHRSTDCWSLDQSTGRSRAKQSRAENIQLLYHPPNTWPTVTPLWQSITAFLCKTEPSFRKMWLWKTSSRRCPLSLFQLCSRRLTEARSWLRFANCHSLLR